MRKWLNKNPYSFLVMLAVIVVSVLAVNYHLMAWSEPTLPPPQGSLGGGGGGGAFWEDAGGNNIMNINTGNVGIGDNSPVKKLTVQSALTGSTGAFTDRPTIRLIQSNNYNYNIGDVHNALEFYSKDSSWGEGLQAYIAAVTTRDNGISHADTGLYIGTSNGATKADYANPQLVIKHDGNVGIGTTSPGAQLAIQRSSNTLYNLHIHNGGGSAKGLLISGGNTGSDASLLRVTRFDGTQTFFEVTDGNSYFPTGNVGINHPSPSNHLDVGGALGVRNEQQLRLYEAAANGANYIGLRAPATLAGDLIFTFPGAYGSSGQVLTTDGAGGLSWTDGGGVAGGGGAAGGGGQILSDCYWKDYQGDIKDESEHGPPPPNTINLTYTRFICGENEVVTAVEEAHYASSYYHHPVTMVKCCRISTGTGGGGGKISQTGQATSNQCHSAIGSNVCADLPYRDITFPEPFAEIPNVVVIPLHVTESPEWGNSMDSLYVYPANVTTTGFRMYCGGSPTMSPGWTWAQCSWLAVVKNGLAAGGGDNLGNHTATMNIGLRNNWLSNSTSTDNGIRITDAGNVGIGATDPSQRLDVNGKIRMRSETDDGDSGDIVATKGYVDNKVSAGRATWIPVNISLGSLRRTTGVSNYLLPASIPANATEILVHVRVRTGDNSGSGSGIWRIYTQQGATQYAQKFFVSAQSQPAWSYNSDNMWLPVTSNRRVYNEFNSTIGSTNYSSNMEILGYRTE